MCWRVAVAGAAQSGVKYPVFITSYEIVMADIKFLARTIWKFLVVDEGHRLKNFNCRLLRELRSLPVLNKLLLSGVPSAITIQGWGQCSYPTTLLLLCREKLLTLVAKLTFTSVFVDGVVKLWSFYFIYGFFCGCSGTPLQNNLSELWSLLNFLLPDVFNSLEDFEGWFDFSAVGEEGGDKQIILQEQRNNVVSKLHKILRCGECTTLL